MMNRKADKELYDNIFFKRAIGMPRDEIAACCGCSAATVNNTISLLNALREQKYEAVEKMINRGAISKAALIWAADKVGVSDVEEVRNLMEAKRTHVEKGVRQKEAQEKEQVAAPAVNYSIYFQRMLELQAQTNELLNQLMDVVVPKYTSDMKDNVNANCDVIGQSLKRMEDKMEAIKIGVRRKGM